MTDFYERMAADPVAWAQYCRELEHQRELAEAESSRATFFVIIWVAVIIILGLICGPVEMMI